MKEDNSGNMGMGFEILVELSRYYVNKLIDLNHKTIRLMQSDEVNKVLQPASHYTKLYTINWDKTVVETAGAIKKVIPTMDYSSQQVVKSIQSIAKQYKELFKLYNFTSLEETLRIEIEQAQLATIMQLCLSYETTMIRDAIGCFANAQYEYLPNVFNKAMSLPFIGAADVAFLKTGKIIPVIESELEYPRGFKSALYNLNKSTAEELIGNSDIKYNTKENQFFSETSKIDAKSMNTVCNGIKVFDSDDLFSEVELMDFVSFLSRTPMMGGHTETGKKIEEWLRELYLQKSNTISFDKELYFHCRSRKVDDMPFTYDEMMKAPYGLPGAGRFNQVGRSHFYFANTKHGAEVEIKKHLRNKEVLQTVMLRPVKEIILLDLSHTLRRGASFLKMIRYPLRNDNENKMPREYLLPCFVADCCKLIGFEGIKYYGSKEYDNYVCWENGYFEDAGMCN